MKIQKSKTSHIGIDSEINLGASNKKNLKPCDSI